MTDSIDTETPVYLKSAAHGWIPAVQLKQVAGGKMARVAVPKFKHENDVLTCGKMTKAQLMDTIDIPFADYDNNVLPVQNVDANGNLEDYKDMVELPFMHEAAILYNLKLRHKLQKPYTRTADIVIAINPYHWLHHLYTKEKQTYYSNRLVWDHNEEDPRTTLEPHVYEISALAYKGLIRGEDQSILVSGESGAGKTETVKICLNHIASTQAQDDYYEDKIVQRIVESNPLLEAFGNAQTRRNDNSSRFGKYLQLQFDKSHHRIEAYGTRRGQVPLVGSQCDVYLLEKNRVVQHDDQERSFHIFYQLLASPDKTQYWSELHNKTPESYSYLGRCATTHIEGVSDADHFRHTVEALQLVGVQGRELHMLMQAICAVLQLGNLRFGALHGDSDKSTVISVEELRVLGDLIGIAPHDLATCMTERTFTTSGETHKVPLNPIMAKDGCDALAKEIYQKVFLWVTKKINDATSVDGTAMKLGTIGLLDIFGFETFEINRFEQLCINYANEKLQQKFTQDVFTNVEKEYIAEGIDLAEIKYEDNGDVLELIEHRSGLIALLNEECVRPKGNDFEYVQKALAINKDASKLMIHRTDRLSFGIKHYAGDVMYSAEFFVTRNLDTLPTDLQECMEKSSNEILSIFQADEVQKPHPHNAPRQKSNIVAATVWTKYRGQLENLMKNLRQTESRYIRCIKPNTEKKELLMEHNLVVDQLRCAGVVAGITIARSVFPNRLPNSLVLTRYSNMCDARSSTTGQKSAEKCKLLLNWLLKDMDAVNENGDKVKAFVVGKTKTFFRAGALEWLESHRIRSVDLQAIIIQKVARSWLVRNKGKRLNHRRRMEEEARRREEQARLAHEARLREEEQQRKAEHQKKIREMEATIQRLESQAEAESRMQQEKLKAARERAELLREEKEMLAERIEERKAKDVRQRIATKELQKKQLDEIKRAIMFLQQQNKLLQKEHMKLELKLEQEMLRLNNASSNCNMLEDSLSNMYASADKVSRNHDSLSSGIDLAKQENEKMSARVDDAQSRYMAQAETRLHLQRNMARILNLAQDKCRDHSLLDFIQSTAYECENDSKVIMAGLEAELDDSGRPSLTPLSDHSSSGTDRSQ
ncbi:hypothetical protein FisN_9Hh321 [Fistulifera solaris]|uniref:Myosin motor domain-containing protein n=1 Tax=Fistulifera solaris TaxID=1519565 RepID=A0A1Z5KCP1_FISSO|nr:hypothetical protein FisN_9Hh321 [Fistulifera solaris]|eukprot:GAX24070.1 hypothetical protein FisN_9Hh321 [Fistulifera solaris]